MSIDSMAEYIARRLNDAVLGFLALLSLFLMFAPSVFSLSPSNSKVLAVLEYAIVLLFCLEYLVAFSLASDKRGFAVNRWRIIDALIIGAALLTLFPAGPEFFRNSPALRLLRLGRIALLGTRSGLALTAPREAPKSTKSAPDSEPKVLVLNATGSAFEKIPWELGLSRIAASEPDWLFISAVTEDRLSPIAAALDVPEHAVAGLFQSNIPRFDRLEQFSTLFVSYPLPMHKGERLRRSPVLLVGSSENVVVLSRECTDLEKRVEDRLGGLSDKMPRMIRATVALLDAIIRANTEVVEHLDLMLFELETDQAELSDQKFLLRTFDLRADILRVSAVHDQGLVALSAHRLSA